MRIRNKSDIQTVEAAKCENQGLQSLELQRSEGISIAVPMIDGTSCIDVSIELLFCESDIRMCFIDDVNNWTAN